VDNNIILALIDLFALGKAEAPAVDALLDVLEFEEPIMRLLELFQSATQVEVAANESPNTLFRGKWYGTNDKLQVRVRCVGTCDLNT
jgi:hypothetical protein